MWGWRLCSVTVWYSAPRCNIENFTVFRICITCFTLSVGFSKMGLEQCLRSVFLLYRKCDYPTLCKNGEDWDLGSVQVSLPWSFIDAAEDVECVDQDKGLCFLPQGKTCALGALCLHVLHECCEVCLCRASVSISTGYFSHHHSQISKRNNLSEEKLVLARSFSILYTYIVTLLNRGFMSCFLL